ncbi:MAG: glycoside hydrolase family 16 protein [Clostridia bacterium]|nr:glycoside hydrolase family 16 protein [Clostridia bacterium]
MKKHRKTALFMAFVMGVFMLASCNGSSENTTPTTTAPTTQTTTQPTVATTTAATTTTTAATTTTVATTTTEAPTTTTKPTTIPTTTYFEYPTVKITEGKQLVWSDEFFGTEINSNNWSHEIGRVRNSEPQFYTNRPENAFVKDGKLHLRAMKENYMGAQYTSASIESKRKQEFQYGIFEIRCKMPDGPGCWPAFWTLGTRNGWPWGGEIDIFEWYSPSPNTFTSTMHWATDYNGHISYGVASYLYRGPEEKNLINDFHTYGMIWTEEEMKFYCDGFIMGGEEILRADKQLAFHQPHYILVNLALSKPNLETFRTTDYIIDYVRVYK